MSSEVSRREQLETLRSAVESDPGSARAHMRLGTALHRAGHIKEADAELSRAVELDPDLDEAWVNLGGVRFSNWDFTGCVEANRRAVACRPEGVPGHFNQGLGHLYLGQAQEMVACFRRVVELEPRHAAGHYYLAAGLNALGDVMAARDSLVRAESLGFSPEPALIKAITKAFEQEGEGGPLTMEIGKGPSGNS